MPFVVLIIVGVIAYVVLHRSMFGRYLYAVGRNEDVARYSGINSQMIILGTYVIEMLLVGMGGILIAHRSYQARTLSLSARRGEQKAAHQCRHLSRDRARFHRTSIQQGP